MVREKAPDYEREFGVVPKFRTGLHGGPVVASECGDHKQEIVYFGDTVNTAARIEQQCKAFDCSFLTSCSRRNSEQLHLLHATAELNPSLALGPKVRRQLGALQ